MMAIEQGTYFKVVCDECGEPFPENDSGGWTLFNSEKEARDEVEGYDGEVNPDGTILCGVCTYEKRTDDALEDNTDAA